MQMELLNTQTSKAMTDKLAEEIKIIAVSFFYWWYNKPGANTEEGFDTWWILYSEENNLSELDKAMQAYHESKLRESNIVESFERENQYVTDEDIEAFARWAVKTSKGSLSPLIEAGIIIGAKAMQNGEIKHNG